MRETFLFLLFVALNRLHAYGRNAVASGLLCRSLLHRRCPDQRVVCFYALGVQSSFTAARAMHCATSFVLSLVDNIRRTAYARIDRLWKFNPAPGTSLLYCCTRYLVPGYSTWSSFGLVCCLLCREVSASYSKLQLVVENSKTRKRTHAFFLRDIFHPTPSDARESRWARGPPTLGVFS